MGLSDRGIGVQAAGFALLGCASLAILQLFSDGDYWLYQWFETAVTRLYWAFVVPLAALFDWGRIMFAKGKAIREAKKAEVIAEMRAKMRSEMRSEMRMELAPEIEAELAAKIQAELAAKIQAELAAKVEAILERHGVEMDKEVADELFGDSRSG